METRDLTRAGIAVSVLGLGAGQLGDESLGARAAERLIHGALELGVTLFDTARSYGESEARLGRALRGRRDGVILSTKIGYGVEGAEDWTPGCIRLGVERARRTLQTDVIDIVHLHSCPGDVLRRPGLVEALLEAREAKTVRAVAYSGDNDALAAALSSGHFDSIQTSVSICDQWSLANVVDQAHAEGLGVIAKRPVANAPWRFSERPTGHECELYWERWQELDVDPGDLSWHELAVRFAAHAPGVSSIITGTSSLDHLTKNAELVAQGPLPPSLTTALTSAYARRAWPGRI